jgi:hypothetical protein
MEAMDFFRCRIDAMIKLRHPPAVLATRLPWGGDRGSSGDEV